MRLTSYKGFESFTLSFRGGTTLLVGPNNAGKSTIIDALRLASHLLNVTKRRNPDIRRRDETRKLNIKGYSLVKYGSDLIDENVRHEFREVESRIELHFKNKAAIYVVWPVDNDAYFYVEHEPTVQAGTLQTVRERFDTIAVVRTMTPLEPNESILSEKYVRDNLGSRLSSRQFRNQLFYYLSRSEDDPFVSFALENTPELESFSVVAQPPDVNVYFIETTSPCEKELSWAGDGLQIWLQILFHIWRQLDTKILILDEPDVYLHPDLQRRLIDLLENLDCQVVLATHASEMLVEANRESVVIVDRTKKASSRISNEQVLTDLNYALGSGFNLKLARVLRSRVALFVEGQDMRVMKSLAKTVGADLVAKEQGLSIVSMGGASKRSLAASFGWLNESLLESAVQVFLVIDRDYLADESVVEILDQFDSKQVEAHVWDRKELESYLLVPATISRISGFDEGIINEWLDEVSTTLKEYTFSRILSSWTKLDSNRALDVSTIYQRCKTEFDSNWKSSGWRLRVMPAKDVISRLNQKIQEADGKPLSSRALAGAMLAHEVPEEMRNFLLGVNRKLA
ncbi:ATP-dependent nuclease [Actinokineospora bangkokensis]|uniref:ATP-dependent nuclease n=1 Tax=Actinokineospora bangkokensis TaxID=1193682 RepID=UPI0013018E84|nr:ATP-binding protein [Actinokineospora bangkokensis]